MLPERAFRVNFLAFLGGLALCWGCAGGLDHGRFHKAGVSYRVGEVPPGFRVVSFRDNDVAYVANHSGHALAVNSTCQDYNDVPLAALTNHLLMGFTEVQTLDQHLETLAGRESLRTHVIAKLDGVPVELGLAVLKRSGCVFDLEYEAPEGRYDEYLPVFRRLLEDFAIESPR